MSKWLKSRTIWTLVFIFVLNGFQAIQGSIPPEIAIVVNAVLTALAMYFRIDARVR